MTAKKKQPQADADSDQNGSTGQKSALSNLRTFTADLARAIRGKKLSGKDLEGVNPAALEAIERGEFSDTLVMKTPPATSDQAEMDPITKQVMKRTGDVKAQMLDIDAELMKNPMHRAAKDLEEAAKAAEKIQGSEDFEVPPAEKSAGAPVEKPTDTPPVPPAVEQPAKPEPSKAEKLKMKEQTLGAELEKIRAEEKETKASELSLKAEEQQVASTSSALKTKEQEVEKTEAELWKQEQATSSSAEQRALEQKRWSVEDERERIEKQRWEIDQHVNDFEARIRKLETKAAELSQHEHSVIAEIDKVKKQESALQAELDKQTVMSQLAEVKKSRTELESAWNDLMTRRKEAEKVEADIVKREESIAAAIQEAEAQEHKAKNPVEVHKHESERWEQEHTLRDIAQGKWKAVEEIEKIGGKISDIQQKSQSVLLMEKNLKAQLAELDKLIKSAEETETSKKAE